MCSIATLLDAVDDAADAACQNATYLAVVVVVVALFDAGVLYLT